VGPRLVECLADEIGDCREREGQLALCWPRLQHPIATGLPSSHCLQPERRLSDARLALDQKGRRARNHTVEKGVDGSELGAAPDDFFLHV
jgi:hypothetical protein